MGGAEGTRTPDPHTASVVRYQLRHSPLVRLSMVHAGEDQLAREVDGVGADVKDGQPRLVWKLDGIKVKFASPIIHRGRLYVCTDTPAVMYCLETATGKELWQYTYGRNGRGSPVLADGKIYVPEVDSRFHILRPGEDKCESLHRQAFRRAAGGPDVEINGSPAVANGRVYFCTTAELYCIGKPDARQQFHRQGARWATEQRQRQRDIAVRAFPRQQRGRLEHHSSFARRVGVACNRAFTGRLKARHEPQQRALAAAGWADEGHEIARGECRVDGPHARRTPAISFATSSARSLEPKTPASEVSTMKNGNIAISAERAMWLAIAQPSSARKCQ